MKRLQLILVVMAMMTMTMAVATEPSKVIVKYQGKKYYVHTVAEGDTLYSLSKAYGVSQESIIEVNALEGEEIKLDSSLYVPFAEERLTGSKNKNRNKQKRVVAEGEHFVSPGETLYSLSRKYNITEQELLDINGLESHTDIKAGMTLKVKRSAQDDVIVVDRSGSEEDGYVHTVEDSDAAASVETEQVEESVVVAEGGEQPFEVVPSSGVLKVTLLLPFHVRGEAKENIVDFYRGVLLGFEDIKAEGRSVELTVLDTKRSVDAVNDMIAFGELDTQLIIGPVYSEEFASLLEYAQERNIPVVSPLQNVEHDSAVLFNMPPAASIKGEAVAELLDGSREVVTIYASRNDNAFIDEVRSIATHTGETSLNFAFDRGSYFYMRKADGTNGALVDIEELMREGSEKVFVVMALSTTDVDRILTTLSSTKSSIRGRGLTYGDYMVVGNREWLKMPNIDRDIFFHNDVVFVVPYYANRIDERVRIFDGRYVKSYGSMPTRTSYRGYDAALIFGRMMFEGVDALLGKTHTPLTTPYRFEYRDGAYENVNWVRQHYRNDSKIVVE